MRIPFPPDDPDLPSTAASGEALALTQAFAEVLRPLARLAVAKGMPFQVLEDQLKRALVEAARDAHPHLPAHRAVSRIATATGLTRREVTRLSQDDAPAPKRRPVAAELFARWMSDVAYRDAAGQPRALPRQGEGASFESLAHSVTRDVHSRSLLDELVRLGLAVHHADRDEVVLVRDAFVPRGDIERMLGFLGHNVGDHLSAATANVLGDGSEHFEQAVFADELSDRSLQELRGLVQARWRELASALVPAIEALLEQDRAEGRVQDRRMRVGLYSFEDHMTSVPTSEPPARD